MLPSVVLQYGDRSTRNITLDNARRNNVASWFIVRAVRFVEYARLKSKRDRVESGWLCVACVKTLSRGWSLGADIGDKARQACGHFSAPIRQRLAGLWGVLNWEAQGDKMKLCVTIGPRGFGRESRKILDSIGNYVAQLGLGTRCGWMR